MNKSKHGCCGDMGKMRRTPVLGGHSRLRQLRQFNFGLQYIEENQLRVVVPLPGLDKSTLKVRARSDIVSISAKVKDELVNYSVRPEDNWDIVLDYPVIAESAKANYADGILFVNFELVEPPQDVEVN